MTRRPLLCSPLTIGSVQLRNRFVFQSHFTALGSDDGEPTEDHVAYHRERARGGVGLIVFESQAVHATGKMSRRYIEAWRPETIAGLRAVTDAAHEQGARIFSQLTHGGHTSLEHPPPLMWAPSQMPEPSSSFSTKALEAEDIATVIDAFATCAAHARQAGFDGVELKVGHDGLLRSFASPYFNRRTDRYGGSFENRMRLVDEVCAAVRSATGPDFPLGVRLCLDEFTPWGYGVDYGVAMGRHLEPAVDYLNSDAGSFSSYWMEIPPFAIPQGRFNRATAALKAAVSVPVVAFGRIKQPAMAEAMLAAGQSDLIGMARQLIADPETPNKVVEGREEEIRYCIGSNDSCIHQVGQQLPIRCDTNPAAGRERRFGAHRLARARAPRRVLVVGGGPAGLKVAETARRRGHEVTLLEARERLGGQLALAARQPLHGEIFDIVDHLAREAARLGVEIRTSTPFDPEAVGADVDEIVFATGSVPALPDAGTERDNRAAGQSEETGLGISGGRAVSGLRGPLVRSVDETLTDDSPAPGAALLVDGNGHWEAVGTAEYLADRGAEVTVITARDLVGADLEGSNRDLFQRRAAEKGISLQPRHRLVGVSADEATLEALDTGARRTLAGLRRVVAVLGRRSVEAPFLTTRRTPPPRARVRRVGDCVAPRLVRAVIAESYELALTL